MTKAQTIGIYAILLFLMAEFVVEYVRPALILALKEDAYLDAARKCHDASSNKDQSYAIANHFGPETASDLHRSAMVGMMECYENEYLRRSLLAWGVNEHELARIDLMARNESNADLRYFIQGMTGDQ